MSDGARGQADADGRGGKAGSCAPWAPGDPQLAEYVRGLSPTHSAQQGLLVVPCGCVYRRRPQFFVLEPCESIRDTHHALSYGMREAFIAGVDERRDRAAEASVCARELRRHIAEGERRMKKEARGAAQNTV